MFGRGTNGTTDGLSKLYTPFTRFNVIFIIGGAFYKVCQKRLAEQKFFPTGLLKEVWSKSGLKETAGAVGEKLCFTGAVSGQNCKNDSIKTPSSDG